MPPPPPPTPAHPLVAIDALLAAALDLAVAEIVRSDELALRAVEVCESERTRSLIRRALLALERWAAVADVELPARRNPKPDSEGGRAGGSFPAPGAVSEPFSLPNVRPELWFDLVRPPQPGQPDPLPNPNPTPPPFPPPLRERVRSEPFRLGEGPQYDFLAQSS